MLNVRITADHRRKPAQVHEEPAGWGRFSRFSLGSQNFLCKIKSIFLNLRVLAGGFAMRYAKIVLVLNIL